MDVHAMSNCWRHQFSVGETILPILENQAAKQFQKKMQL